MDFNKTKYCAHALYKQYPIFKSIMRNRLFIPLFIMLAIIGACSGPKGKAPSPYVTVNNGNFYLGDSVYRYIGTNFWYGTILASEGRGGNRDRLARELDSLKSLGITNLRILVGGEGEEGLASHISPTLQTAPGVYNDTLLQGLDYLLDQLEKRDMKAVLYLNNAWEWSGGYTSFLEWAGEGDTPLPAVESYGEYCDHAAKFLRSDSAKALFADHVAKIVPRYADSPALLSWQICNEPRPYGRTPEQKKLMAEWLLSTARQIKALDANHLVSTGSEGSVGCEMDLDLWAEIHAAPEIDYATIHIWPTNWGWVRREEATDSVGRAIAMTDDYITEHVARMKPLRKPVVLEEFGYPRDGQSILPESATLARDEYYRHIITRFRDGSSGLSGLNFWAWGGEGIPGKTYTGDPAHEPQGLFSVFATDSTTISVISDNIPQTK